MTASSAYSRGSTTSSRNTASTTSRHGGTINFMQGANSRFYVNGVGNVGIGTTVPTSKLAVKTATNRNLSLTLSGDKVGWLNDTGTSWVNSNWSGLTQMFKVGQFASIDAMFIDASGKVGIGTSNPTKAKVEISGVFRRLRPG